MNASARPLPVIGTIRQDRTQVTRMGAQGLLPIKNPRTMPGAIPDVPLLKLLTLPSAYILEVAPLL